MCLYSHVYVHENIFLHSDEALGHKLYMIDLELENDLNVVPKDSA